jgi:peptidoglycan hydrolase-like protein with peptidoglycan-binding domain
MIANRYQKSLLFGLLCVAVWPCFALADSYGDRAVFNIDKNYDSARRTQAAASLVWAGEKIYFYADDAWWNALDSAARSRYNAAFDSLDGEFSRHIRPKLTELFGESANPNFSRNGKLTILVHQMAKDAGGYINTGDGYSKYQAPQSNEREMVYFNTLFIDSPLAKAYLAHEYVHLITFNQKDRLRNVVDDVWLNETRAEYSSTILGYDSPFAQSNFEQRTKSFFADSGKSLTDWQNVPANYGVAHLWAQYVVDHYGIAILADSMKTDKTGIASIEYALAKNGIDMSFERIFRDWVIALAANDCSLGDKYCYKHADLKNFTAPPKINYLPASDQVSLSVIYNTPYFAGNWQKIIGAGGSLRLDFEGAVQGKFIVPYLACSAAGKCVVGDLETAADGNAMLKLENFGQQYASLTLMPFAAGKTSDFDGANQNAPSYSFKISIVSNEGEAGQSGKVSEEQKMQALLAQIEALKKEIARVRAILAARAAAPQTAFSCTAITADLYLGAQNNNQIVCLQEFLRSQGSLIYPGGLLSGNFDAATRAAVIRFQEKYAAEILRPLGLKSGTGYVGASTRAKINRLIK